MGQITADFGSDETPCLLRCIVHLAAGDQARLENVCRLALSDTRDNVNRAEYDADHRRIREFGRPFPQES